MNNLKKFILFIYEKIFGIILLGIFAFLSLSSFSYSTNDPHFSYTGSGEKINNLMGKFGAYYSGTVQELIGSLQFLIPLFFLITGVKKIIGVKTGYTIIHFLSFSISIVFLSLLSNLLTNEINQLGTIIVEIININFLNFFENISYFLTSIISVLYPAFKQLL